MFIYMSALIFNLSFNLIRRIGFFFFGPRFLFHGGNFVSFIKLSILMISVVCRMILYVSSVCHDSSTRNLKKNSDRKIRWSKIRVLERKVNVFLCLCLLPHCTVLEVQWSMIHFVQLLPLLSVWSTVFQASLKSAKVLFTVSIPLFSLMDFRNSFRFLVKRVLAEVHIFFASSAISSPPKRISMVLL